MRHASHTAIPYADDFLPLHPPAARKNSDMHNEI
jgi:hypothetical protein